MKNIIFYLLALLFSNLVNSQVLFNQISQPTSLNPDQQENFTVYSNLNTYSNLDWMNIGNLSDFVNSNTGILSFTLPTESGQLNFQFTHAEYIDNFNFEWYGERKIGDITSEDYVLFKMMDGLLFGELSINSSYYKIYPVSSEIQILVKLPNPEVGIIQPDLGDGGTDYVPESLDTCILDSSNCILDVYVAFTPSVANLMPLPKLLPIVNMMISQLNMTYLRSRVKHRARLANLSKLLDLGWTNKGNSNDDIDQLGELVQGPSDLRTRMDNAKADIVFLLTSDNAWPSDEHGIAFKCAAIPCAISKIGSATNQRYTFTHETGHLLCGGHEDDGGAFSKAYEEPAGTFKSVIHQAGAITKRILNYSNPFVKYSGKETGSKYRFNACVIQNSGCGVTSFNIPYICTISAKGSFDNECNPTMLKVTATLVPSTCVAQHYDFSYSFDGFTYFTVCAFTTNNFCNIPLLGIPNNKSVSVKITAYGNGVQIIAYAFKTFITNCPVQSDPNLPGSIKKKGSNELLPEFEIVNDANIIVTNKLPEEKFYEFIITDIAGKIVLQNRRKIINGINAFNLTDQGVPKGIYVLVIKENDNLLFSSKIVTQ